MVHTEADPPKELLPFIRRLETRLSPSELWLFGSRARGDAREDSDWDLLAVLPDDAPAADSDPLLAWTISREADVPITLLVTRVSDLAAIWGRPNTIGYDLVHEGLRLHVD